LRIYAFKIKIYIPWKKIGIMLKNKHAYLLLLVFIAGFILIALKGLKASQPGDENSALQMLGSQTCLNN